MNIYSLFYVKWAIWGWHRKSASSIIFEFKWIISHFRGEKSWESGFFIDLYMFQKTNDFRYTFGRKQELLIGHIVVKKPLYAFIYALKQVIVVISVWINCMDTRYYWALGRMMNNLGTGKIETERLILRKFTMEDAVGLFLFLGIDNWKLVILIQTRWFGMTLKISDVKTFLQRLCAFVKAIWQTDIFIFE